MQMPFTNGARCRTASSLMQFAGRTADRWRLPVGRAGGAEQRNPAELRRSNYPANATMQALYDGMPVILEEEHLPVWLGERAGYPTSLMQPADDGLIHLWAVNSVRNNSPDLLDRINDPRAPPPLDAPPSDNPT